MFMSVFSLFTFAGAPRSARQGAGSALVPQGAAMGCAASKASGGAAPPVPQQAIVKHGEQQGVALGGKPSPDSTLCPFGALYKTEEEQSRLQALL